MNPHELIKEYRVAGHPIKRKWRNQSGPKCYGRRFWFVLLSCLLLFIFHYLFLVSNNKGFSFSSISDSTTNDPNRKKNQNYCSPFKPSEIDSCSGRYIYIHDLPSKFNENVLKNCELATRATDRISMCSYVANLGLGPRIENSGEVLSENSWYSTNQFFLEVIFHNRMKKYECLTNDSSLASAIYVPFYAGLDLRRYLWGFRTSMRDASGVDLVKWLLEKPEWKKMWGRDHFLVSGRISNDFRRQSDRNSNWGSKFRFLPESKNMSMLTIESGSWNNDFAIPYPTYFHPSTDGEVLQWQDRMRKQRRPYLFSFAGAARLRQKGSVRNEIIRQCTASKTTCKLLDCNTVARECDDPVNLMKLFQSSVFCLQPPGDSFTRRSTFDSILAGCIPVFFHPKSAYSQYVWHLPKNHSKYSVFVSPRELRQGKVLINETLLQVSKDEELAMREEVIRLIPNIIYADPRSRLETTQDAFDLSVRGILEKIEKAKREIS
ncbi:hypothetical protein SLE2022_152790 [Rubroshorea leprosula]